MFYVSHNNHIIKISQDNRKKETKKFPLRANNLHLLVFLFLLLLLFGAIFLVVGILVVPCLMIHQRQYSIYFYFGVNFF